MLLTQTHTHLVTVLGLLTSYSRRITDSSSISAMRLRRAISSYQTENDFHGHLPSRETSGGTTAVSVEGQMGHPRAYEGILERGSSTALGTSLHGCPGASQIQRP